MSNKNHKSVFPLHSAVKFDAREKIAELEKRLVTTQKAFIAMSETANSNYKIMAHMLAILEILKEKGLYHESEVQAKLIELDKATQQKAKDAIARERARIIAEKDGHREGNPTNITQVPVQSEGSGSVENHSGGTKLRVLPASGDGADTSGPQTND